MRGSEFSNPPVGFERYQCKEDDYPRGLELLVPGHVRDQLLADDAKRKIEEERIEAETKAARVQEVNRGRFLDSMSDESPRGSRNTTTVKDEDDSVKAMLAWSQIDSTDATLRSRKNYPVFSSAQALELHKNLGRTGDSDTKARLVSIYTDLVHKGTTLREIALPKSMKALEQLAISQPQMKAVISSIVAQINLAKRSSKPVRLQPMLLVSEPGVGKSHFVQALAQALSTTIHVQQMDADVTASYLMGSDKHWGNSTHGALFQNLVLGAHANPIFVLDELDKCQRTLSSASPLGAMYSVLEPITSKGVRDISVNFEFDASQVTWIATANDARLLDAPLRSRFREFHIMPPTASECLVLAEEVMRAAIESVAVKGFKADVSLRRHLAHLPARQISQLTLEAVAHAVAANRFVLRPEDFPRWLFDDDATVKAEVKPSYRH